MPQMRQGSHHSTLEAPRQTRPRAAGAAADAPACSAATAAALLSPSASTDVLEAEFRDAVTADPWIDRSFEQSPTTWQPGDEERFQSDIRLAPEGLDVWMKLGLAVLVLALIAGVLLLS